MTDEQLVQALTRHLEAGAEIPDLGAPYDDLVAGLISGALLDDERAAAVRMLQEHPAYVTLLARTAASEPGAASEVPAGRVVRLRPLVAAAAVIAVGIGAAIYLDRTDPPPARGDTLVSAVRELRTRRPGLFEGFEPLKREERAERVEDVRRGGLTLVEPRSAILDARPTFRWHPLEGTTTATLTVINEDARTLWKTAVTGAEATWPRESGPLPAGQYVWKLVVDTAGRRLTSTIAFERIGEAAASRYRAGLEAIGASDARSVLLQAHWAIRNGLLLEARTLLDAAGDTEPARETRAWLASRLGD